MEYKVVLTSTAKTQLKISLIIFFMNLKTNKRPQTS